MANLSRRTFHTRNDRRSYRITHIISIIRNHINMKTLTYFYPVYRPLAGPWECSHENRSQFPEEKMLFFILQIGCIPMMCLLIDFTKKIDHTSFYKYSIFLYEYDSSDYCTRSWVPCHLAKHMMRISRRSSNANTAIDDESDTDVSCQLIVIFIWPSVDLVHSDFFVLQIRNNKKRMPSYWEALHC